MDATFLVGSGISLPSGLPTVEDITNNLFEKSYYETYRTKTIKQGDDPSHVNLKPLQDFLKQLKKIQDDYLHEKIGISTNSDYEDLFYLLEQIRNEDKGDDLNAALNLFMKKIDQLSIEYRNRYDKRISLGYFCERCMALIYTVINQSILETEVKEMGNFVKLAKKGINLKIFTLNHDTLIEKLLTENEIGLEDGFSELDGDVRWYKSDVYNNEDCNHIYHLHGAKNWKRLVARKSIEGDLGYLDIDQKLVRSDFKKKYTEEALGIISPSIKYNVCHTGGGKELIILYETGYILIGSGKSSKYHLGIYEDLQSRFARQLRSTNRIIVSGYGWNDYAINKKLEFWLQDKQNKIMLIHKYPEQMVKQSRYLTDAFLNSYFDQIETENHWFGEISSIDITGFLL